MGRSNRRLVLLLLLAVAGLGAWWVGRYAWGTSALGSGKEALRRRDFPAARAHLARSLGVWPRDGEVLLLAAQAARRGGDAGEANRLLRDYQQRHGIDEGLELERRLLHLQGGDMKGADAYLARCAEAPDDPHTPVILEAVIEGGLRSGDLGRALRGANLWLRGAHDRADRVQGLVWRGNGWAEIGEREKAQADFARAVELDGEHDAARLGLAACLVRLAPREALGHLERLLAKQPRDPSARYHLARCRRTLGQYEEACRLLDELLAEHPDEGAFLFERGTVALDLRRLAEAERWLRRACDLRPNDPEPRRSLASCLRQTGKEKEAQECEDRADRMATQLASRAAGVRQAAEGPQP
jgi:tetratricopeptide (TPR) repeat protein